MLTAIDSNDNIVIASRSLESTNDFNCRHCGGKLILKKGTIKTPHFSHIKKRDCEYDNYIKEKCGGESETHYKWKLEIKNQMEQMDYVDRVELEVKIGNRIADIVVYLNDNDDKDYRSKDKFIVEVQLSKINLETIINRSSDYIKEGYDDTSIFWLMGKKNKILALKTSSAILEDDFKLYAKGYADKTYNLVDIVGDNIDIFQDGCSGLIFIIEYKQMLIFKEKLKLCQKFLKDVDSRNLHILNIIKIISEGKNLRIKHSNVKDEILNIQNKNNLSKIDIHSIKKLDEDRIKLEKSINDTIVEYRNAINEYVEKYNIECELLKELINQLSSLINNCTLRNKILGYGIKDENIIDWQTWDDNVHTEDKKEIDTIYGIACNIYKFENKDVCLHIDKIKNDEKIQF